MTTNISCTFGHAGICSWRCSERNVPSLLLLPQTKGGYARDEKTKQKKTKLTIAELYRLCRPETDRELHTEGWRGAEAAGIQRLQKKGKARA